MKWHTHKKIVQNIGARLGFKQDEIKLLEKGAIAPDRWRDYPHHSKELSLEKAYKFGLVARKLFLRNKKASFFYAGIVTHYIADAFIPPVDSFDGEEYETKLDEISKSLTGLYADRLFFHKLRNIIDFDLKDLIYEIPQTNLHSYFYMLTRIKPPENPHLLRDYRLTFNLAARTSLCALKSILNKNIDNELHKKIGCFLKELSRKSKNLTLIIFLLFSLGILCTFSHLTFISAGFFVPFLIMIYNYFRYFIRAFYAYKIYCTLFLFYI